MSRTSLTFALVLALAAVTASCSSHASGTSTPPSSSAPAPTTPPVQHPNIVFILTDDLSWNLVTPQIAPHIVQLENAGMTFDHYFVADSLCCPSRSTIFTGLFPHDTQVETNLPPDGGFQKFQSRDLAPRTYAVALHDAGYQTSMLGKYLNGYGDLTMTPATAPVPQGWSDWHVSNSSGYFEYDFTQNDNGNVTKYTGPDNYGVDVLNRAAQSFIRMSATRPFSVEVATYAPHQPYVPAIRNENDFPGLSEPRDPSFNAANQDPPSWMADRPPLGPLTIARLDLIYRKRAQTVEAVDKLVADTEATLAAEHLTDKTYLVFSSDNGYHLGQHRLARGKQTAFDTDIRVPLIVDGPGVTAGTVDHHVVENVDLYPTFTELAGATPDRPIDGHSIVPLLLGRQPVPAWRTVALLEHRHHVASASDPDNEGGRKNDPTTYEGIRISAPSLPGFRGPVESVYVEYADPKQEVEYYDITKDPYEIDNIAGSLTSAQRDELQQILHAYENCHDASTCWAAGMPM